MLVPAGTYLIEDIVRIGYSDVVLRGAGSGSTTLFAPRSLEEIVGINRSRYGSTNSAWGYNGWRSSALGTAGRMMCLLWTVTTVSS
ncbi:hypothetical protein ALI22I_40300 [Saccharothrix sp. ALI-22-I]|nr:hypothetical protein ALI22I_40300 [Saccharothrix sp. ALI-22-I]